MDFTTNNDLLVRSNARLFDRKYIYWIIGGAGSGKTTICQALSTKFDIPLYCMDSHIYGTYHSRFLPERHPANFAWSSKKNGLAWFLDMSWEEFNNFNQAALPEYVDLLAADIDSSESGAKIIIDGGVCNPALLTRIISPTKIVCIERPERSSIEIWEEDTNRRAMKDLIHQLPNPKKAWKTFLEFDTNITETIQKECLQNSISVCSRKEVDSIDELTEKIQNLLRIS